MFYWHFIIWIELKKNNFSFIFYDLIFWQVIFFYESGEEKCKWCWATVEYKLMLWLWACESERRVALCGCKALSPLFHDPKALLILNGSRSLARCIKRATRYWESSFLIHVIESYTTLHWWSRDNGMLLLLERPSINEIYEQAVCQWRRPQM